MISRNQSANNKHKISADDKINVSLSKSGSDIYLTAVTARLSILRDKRFIAVTKFIS
jgi:hypothetical protein